MWKTRRFSLLSIVAALCLLGGAGYDRWNDSSAHSVEPYLAQVRTAVDELPLRIGNWVGREIPQPPAAVALLRPNALISREYVDLLEGHRANLLIVHCADARDMQGHYPPNCYPNSGWRQINSQQRQWEINGRVIRGVSYEFEGQPLSGRPGIVIYNSLMLPGEQFIPDMATVRQRAANARARLWGAGQLQVAFDSTVSEPERDAIFVSLVALHEPVLAAILDKTDAIGHNTTPTSNR